MKAIFGGRGLLGSAFGHCFGGRCCAMSAKRKGAGAGCGVAVRFNLWGVSAYGRSETFFFGVSDYGRSDTFFLGGQCLWPYDNRDYGLSFWGRGPEM